MAQFILFDDSDIRAAVEGRSFILTYAEGLIILDGFADFYHPQDVLVSMGPFLIYLKLLRAESILTQPSSTFSHIHFSASLKVSSDHQNH